MPHTAYIIASYAIAVGVPLIFSIQVLFRVRSARQRLMVIDTRRARGQE
jgi:hypothetical protein